MAARPRGRGERTQHLRRDASPHGGFKRPGETLSLAEAAVGLSCSVASQFETKFGALLRFHHKAISTDESSNVHVQLHSLLASCLQAMSVEFLLARGAEPSAKNDDGATASELARGKGRADLARTIDTFVPSELPEADTTETEAMRANEMHEEEVD